MNIAQSIEIYTYINYSMLLISPLSELRENKLLLIEKDRTSSACKVCQQKWLNAARSVVQGLPRPRFHNTFLAGASIGSNPIRSYIYWHTQRLISAYDVFGTERPHRAIDAH